MKINLQYSLASCTKSIFLSVFFILFAISSAISQAPAIEWENTIGGSQGDILLSCAQTDDGGYILGGYSDSGISGDKTENNYGLADYWIVKLTETGEIEWQETIGGSQSDYLMSIFQTDDGGYIAGGYSNSNISVDKTENCHGLYDYWIVKLNAIGEIEWQNTIGGNNYDYLECVIQIADGGYFVGGKSFSNISGDKTENSNGSQDYWVIKLNSLGNIVWQNTIGGSGTDVLQSVAQLPDGTYYVGGYSFSGASGDKSENNIGDNDLWLLKLNSLGVIEWENTIGGNLDDKLRSVNVTSDGGCIIGAQSTSSISGDKTEDSIGYSDYWIIKLNSLGIIEWQNTIGGSEAENIASVIQLSDGQYFVAGYSQSNISGDKTENVYVAHDYDYWVLKINDIGAIQWQYNIGASYWDKLSCSIQTMDGGFFLGGYSQSNISGNKSENSFGGTWDYWVVKLAGPACIPASEMCNLIDDDCDGLIDEGASPTISISAGGATTFCQGSNVILTATHTGTGLQWKKNGTIIPGATGVTYAATTTGGYTCESSNACGTTLSASISVTANKNPPASITAGGPTSFCAGGSVVLTANAGGGLSYQWYKGATPIAGATNIAYTATTSGNYKCRVTKTATGCFKNSNAIMVNIVCRDGENETPSQILEAYPNPATTQLNITCSANINTAQLYNELGQLIMEISVSDGYAEADISTLSAGMYIIRAGGEVVQWVKQ